MTIEKPFVVRVRDPSTMRRIHLPSPNTTKVVLNDLQKEIEEICIIPIKDQLLSKDPQYTHLFTKQDSQKLLKDLQINHGDILYVKSIDSPKKTNQTTTSNNSSIIPISTKKIETTTTPTKLTSQCQHGKNGRCLRCSAATPGVPPVIHGKCNHGLNMICIHCSSYIKEHSKDDQKPSDEKPREVIQEWLCTHPPNVFCVKCIPPDFAKEEYERRKKIDLKPFQKIIQDKKAMCKFRHSPTTVCAICAPPKFPSYVGKPNCDANHPPWPRGVCTKCAPPSAVIRAQEYRHVDGISLPQDLVAGFYRRWCLQEKREVLKASLLFGHWIDEVEDIDNPGAIRAIVSAIYEPPQQGLPKGVRQLKDDCESDIEEFASECGQQPVGWIIAVNPRPGGEKYFGKVFLSGQEVCIAASQQCKYTKDGDYSRFATIVVEHSDTIEPKAYQVSDQCQALVRDGIIIPSSEDPFLVTSKVQENEISPSLVLHNVPLPTGISFNPDPFLVKVRVMTSNTSYCFRYYEFPSFRQADIDLVKMYLHAHQHEQYKDKLSDFNLLYTLMKLNILSKDTVYLLLQHYYLYPNESSIPLDLSNEIDNALISKGLIDL